MKTKSVTIAPAIYIDTTRHPNDSIVANAQNVFGKRYALIPISEIDIDNSYQREQDEYKVRKLAQNWKDELYDPIKVAYRDNRFKNFEGGHRFLAQVLLGRQEVICEICDASSLEDEAYIFVHQNDNVNKLKPIDTFKANIILNDYADCTIQKLCDEFNIAISKSSTKNKPNIGQALTEVRAVVNNQGEDCLRWIFEILTESKWIVMPSGCSSFMFRVFKIIYNTFPDDAQEVKKILLNYFMSEPTMSPKTLKAKSSGERPDLDYRSAAVVFLWEIVEKELHKDVDKITKNLYNNSSRKERSAY